jgi:ankyrin repeat protein
MLLIRHGADVNVKGRLGRTPLHLALGNENEDLAEYCRLAGAKSIPWSTRVKLGLLSSSPPTLMQTARVVVRETIMKRQNANVVAVVDSMEELPSDVKHYLKYVLAVRRLSGSGWEEQCYVYLHVMLRRQLLFAQFYCRGCSVRSTIERHGIKASRADTLIRSIMLHILHLHF